MRQSLIDYARTHKIESYQWCDIFDAAGYPKVKAPFWYNQGLSPKAKWCEENIDSRDYCYFYETVYFTHDEDAINFALRWA